MKSILLLFGWLCTVHAFVVVTTKIRPRRDVSCADVIQPDAADLTFDRGSGGVRLAKESVIELSGSLKNNKFHYEDLKRFTELTQVGEPDFAVVVGRGVEEYEDPGPGTKAGIRHAPLQAMEDAVGSIQNKDNLVVNFCGGSDLQALEVKHAIQYLKDTLQLQSPIMFRSLSHEMFPDGHAYVTIVNDAEEQNSEIFFYDGKYWTLSEEHINNDLV